MYRSIETSMWSDPDFESLTVYAKLLFVYLITSPYSHVSGIYYVRKSVVIEETGLTEKAYRSGIDTLSKLEMCYFDIPKNIVWVKNGLKRQGRGHKVFISAANHLKTLHNSFLIKDFLDYYPQVGKLCDEGFVDTLSDRVSEFAFPNPNPNPVSDPVPEKGRRQKKTKPEKFPIPPDWQPTDAMVQKMADETGFPHSIILEETENMRDWALDSGATGLDWNARWRRWIRRARRDGLIGKGRKETGGQVRAVYNGDLFSIKNELSQSDIDKLTRGQIVARFNFLAKIMAKEQSPAAWAIKEVRELTRRGYEEFKQDFTEAAKGYRIPAHWIGHPIKESRYASS